MSEAAYLKTLDLKAAAHFPTFLYHKDDSEESGVKTVRFATLEAVQEYEEENPDVELFDNPGLKLIPKPADIAGIVANAAELQDELDSVTAQLDMATKANAELSKMNAGLLKDTQSLKDQLQAALDQVKDLKTDQVKDLKPDDIPADPAAVRKQGSAPATSTKK